MSRDGDPEGEAEPTPEVRGARTLAESLRLYLDRRLLIIFVFGMAQGYPWVLIGSAMTAWLQESGLTRSAIGFFGSILGVYAVNFLWAPFVDRLRIPLLYRLGPRRSWILAMQLLMATATLAIAFTEPDANLTWTAILALGLAICSATQDMAIDAYRVEIIPRHEAAVISHGAAAITAGWWTGFALLGAIPFFLADLPGWSWSRVYFVLAALWVPLMVTVLLVPPSRQRRDRFQEAETKYRAALGGGDEPSAWQRVITWLAVTVVEPIREFFTRSGPRLAVTVLLFLFLFKIGEAFLGRMSIVFYKEVGFTDAQIGTYSKLLGGTLTIVYSLFASIFNARFGLIKGLLIGGIAMAGSNLMFSWIALAGPDERLYAAAIFVDNFTAAFSTVAFVAFISFLTSHTYTATQYALMASISTFGRTTMASASGVVVDAMDGNWALFFVLTALMVIPSLLLLIYVAKLLRERVEGWQG